MTVSSSIVRLRVRTANRMRPFSGAFGSLSSRAISSRAIAMRPFAISPAGVRPRRWKRTGVMKATPGTPSRRDHRAQIDRRPNVKRSGWKKPGRRPAALGAERIEQALLDVGREIAGLRADVQRDVERHETRRVDLHVVPGQPVALDEAAQLVFEVGVDARRCRAGRR